MSWELSLPLLGSATVAFALTSVFLPVVIVVAHRLGLVDRPGGRKTHRDLVPRIGGVAIIGGTALALGSGLLLPSLWPAVARNLHFLTTLVWGGGMVFVLGLYDDIRGTNAPFKFLVQGLAAMVALAAGLRFTIIGIPFFGTMDLGTLSVPLTLIWIIGVTNAINLIDGLDGLAAGMTLIICAAVGSVSIFRGDLLSAVVCCTLAGALVGFLRFNWNPAKIFMGDSGSMFIGFLLAILALRSSNKGPTAVAITVPILALGVPVFDTLLVMTLRFRDREERTLAGRVLRMFRADRNHLHHLLLDHLRGHHRGAVLSVYGLGIAFALASLATSFSTNSTFGYLMLAIGLALVALVRWLLSRRIAARLEPRDEPEESWPTQRPVGIPSHQP